MICYIAWEKNMIIEAGNWYKTKEGKNAFVGFIMPRDIYPVIGYIDNYKSPSSWSLDGEYVKHDIDCIYNLIELIGPELPQKPLILQEGNWYKTRDGEKVFIYIIDNNTNFILVCYGFFKGEKLIHSWNQYGNYFNHDYVSGECGYDLIEEIITESVQQKEYHTFESAPKEHYSEFLAYCTAIDNCPGRTYWGICTFMESENKFIMNDSYYDLEGDEITTHCKIGFPQRKLTHWAKLPSVPKKG